MSNAKFKVGQVVIYKSATNTKRARKGGTITKIEKMYELKDEYKRPYAGELTTVVASLFGKGLSKGKFKGYAYRINSIQPKGYAMDVTMIEENNLQLSIEFQILKSYTS